VGLIGPYSVEAYVSRDGAEACISLGGWAYCSADGGASVRRLELEFRGLEPSGFRIRRNAFKRRTPKRCPVNVQNPYWLRLSDE